MAKSALIRLGISILRLSDREWEYTVTKAGWLLLTARAPSESAAFFAAANYIAATSKYRTRDLDKE